MNIVTEFLLNIQLFVSDNLEVCLCSFVDLLDFISCFILIFRILHKCNIICILLTVMLPLLLVSFVFCGFLLQNRFFFSVTIANFDTFQEQRFVGVHLKRTECENIVQRQNNLEKKMYKITKLFLRAYNTKYKYFVLCQ